MITQLVSYLQRHNFEVVDSGEKLMQIVVPFIEIQIQPDQIFTEAVRLKAVLEQVAGPDIWDQEFFDGVLPNVQADFCPIDNTAALSVICLTDTQCHFKPILLN